MNWYTPIDDGFLLRIWVTPNAKKTALNGLITRDNNDIFLKVSISTPPDDGKATKALLVFLAKKLKIAPSYCVCVKGQTSRFKLVSVKKCTNKDIDCLLE